MISQHEAKDAQGAKGAYNFTIGLQSVKYSTRFKQPMTTWCEAVAVPALELRLMSAIGLVGPP
jgi:hypothetical protein